MCRYPDDEKKALRQAAQSPDVHGPARGVETSTRPGSRYPMTGAHRLADITQTCRETRYARMLLIVRGVVGRTSTIHDGPTQDG
ncbi:MAG: hypothetical protein JOZ32_09925 [Bryobacterales bacterium]|nr:hypothetical protein [Bryobacterales bacterium]